MNRQKSIVSHAASISAWNAVLDWPSIVAAFRVDRQVVVSSSAAFKKMAVTEVKSQIGADDVPTWIFVYNAFLKTTGATSLKLEFYDGSNYSADKSLTGVDPKMTVLQGDIEITEDDNITKGKTYTLKLTGKVRGKEVTFATGQIKMN